MPYDDNRDDPITGLGDEIVPERGLPFDVEEDETPSITLNDIEKPREVTEEELALLMGLPDDDDKPSKDRDKGMGAVEPILRDGDIPDIASTTEDVKLPDQETAARLPYYDRASFMADPTMRKAREEREGSAKLTEDEKMLNKYVTDDRLTRLWDRIDQAQYEIREHIPSLDLARTLYDQVERARNEFLNGRKNFEETERTVNEVELRISAVIRAGKDKGHAILMLMYEIVWTVALVFVGITFLKLTNDPFSQGVVSAMAGGIGAIVGAITVLWKHAAREMDYSRQYYMWYITTPLLGMILGVFIYAAIGGGIVYYSTGNEELTSPTIIYILAFIVGYQQNVAYDIMRRILRLFRLAGDDDEEDEDRSKSDGD
jgi:hypothetical protein